MHKTICDRAVDGNVTLKGASLIEAGDGKFIIRMLPDSVSSEQITDASNHLITGKITVEGIGMMLLKEIGILLTFAFKNASAPIFSKLEPSAKFTVASPVHL